MKRIMNDEALWEEGKGLVWLVIGGGRCRERADGLEDDVQRKGAEDDDNRLKAEDVGDTRRQADDHGQDTEPVGGEGTVSSILGYGRRCKNANIKRRARRD